MNKENFNKAAKAVSNKEAPANRFAKGAVAVDLAMMFKERGINLENPAGKDVER